eukprot:TRINITY_DN1195_c0_g2_i8.p1 TRINITY_DN1195_c0_g2~~TRINITY_DN1195_c0_g2_i8.p1  ORF type:complete len:244 (-),score=35.03 TRINITY_DN1195_c0_g2_i8:163-861(-)
MGGDCVHAVYAYEGAQVAINCTEIKLDSGTQGVKVRDAESRIIMQRCMIEGGGKNGAEVESGGYLEMVQCEMKGCLGGSGLRVHGKGSKAMLYQTCIVNNHKHGVIVQSGAVLLMNRCDVLGSKEGRGILADGLGTRLELEQCEVGKCKLLCVRATHQAEMIIKRSDIHDSRELHGVAADTEARVTLTDCRIFDNKQIGVVALSGGFVQMIRTEVWGSKVLRGVLVACIMKV